MTVGRRQRRLTARDRRRDRTSGAIALFVPLAVITVVSGFIGASILGSLLFAVTVIKLLIARYSRRHEYAYPAMTRSMRVSIVMPMHNEDPAFAVAAVSSMLVQSRSPDRVHVLDDGSSDGGAAADAVEAVLQRDAHDIPWTVTRLAENVGKRGALAVGFRADTEADIFLCVDSDTVLDPEAVAAGLRPFCDERTTAVAGRVSAQNWSRNVLTRLIDLRYVSAFLAERAAYSFFGAVLCCCGSLAFYRAEIVRANLDDFVDQRFLGRVATYGDDRRLTNYALRNGRVVLCPSARASTAVPERIGHYVRQQVRWNKSFIRESTWVLGTFPFSANAFWLTLCEVFMWMAVSTLLGVTVGLWVLGAVNPAIAPYVLFIAAAAYARNAVYLSDNRPEIRRRDRLAVYALAPVYGILHLFVLTPLRMWSLLTLRRTRWGTRRKVEVRYVAA